MAGHLLHCLVSCLPSLLALPLLLVALLQGLCLEKVTTQHSLMDRQAAGSADSGTLTLPVRTAAAGTRVAPVGTRSYHT